MEIEAVVAGNEVLVVGMDMEAGFSVIIQAQEVVGTLTESYYKVHKGCRGHMGSWQFQFHG